MLVTSTGAEVNLPDVRYDFNTVSGVPYTLSAYVYVPAGMPTVNLYAPLTSFGTTSTLFNQWERLYVTFTPNATTGFYVALLNHSTAAGQTFYVDKVLCEQSATLNPYIEGTVTTVPFSGWGVPR